MFDLDTGFPGRLALNRMPKVAILGSLRQQADALSTQFRRLYVLYNDKIYNRNKAELISSERVIYRGYSALSVRQEFSILRKLLKDISPDIVYTNGFRHLWMVGLLVREPGSLPKRPLVLVTSHSSWAWQKAHKRALMALAGRIFADGIFTLALFQEKRLRKLGIPPFKLRTIPNAVDVEQFSPLGPRDYFADIIPGKAHFLTIVNVANINPSKGQEVIIRSISRVKKEIDQVRLVLLGNYSPASPYHRYLKKLISESGLESNVYLLGSVDHRQIPSALRSSDISVISSWNEVCPFILLESLAAGKVTISTAVGGIPDIVKNGFNGFLVQPGDPEGLADCILKVINNPSLKLAIEKQARLSAVENYSFDVIGGQHRDFLASIVRHKRPIL